MQPKHFVAFDLGATSGRTILGSLRDGELVLKELTRFPNTILPLGGHYYWNIFSLYEHLCEGLRAAAREGVEIASVGIDTWGVDFAFVGKDGSLLGLPYAYRDPHTDGAPEEYFSKVLPREEVYGATGIQIMQFNSLYQLYAMQRDRSSQLAAACGLPQLPVIAVAGHDTASAVAAVPAADERFAYLSSGTWSLMGIEVREPFINELTERYNFTNEGGVEGTTRLLKNITGMWILEQCLRKWKDEGRDYTYPEIVKMATGAAPFRTMIDPDDASFAAPGDMPAAIRAYCERTGQPAPGNDSAMIRAIFESLALKYRFVLDRFRSLAPFEIERLHVIGGGSKNALLNQFTADSLGIPVTAGPSEATAVGNIMLQARAAGCVGTLQEMRTLIARCIPVEEFTPGDTAAWDAAYTRFMTIVK